jgi:hypothetical protein
LKLSFPLPFKPILPHSSGKKVKWQKSSKSPSSNVQMRFNFIYSPTASRKFSPQEIIKTSICVPCAHASQENGFGNASHACTGIVLCGAEEVQHKAKCRGSLCVMKPMEY